MVEVTCDGSYECPADQHMHGCFSDNPCRHPEPSSEPLFPTTDCPSCYGRPRGECPNCGTRGPEDANEPLFTSGRLVMVEDGSSDLLLFDAEGDELPQPYSHAVIQAALVRISGHIDGYLRRMEEEWLVSDG